MKDLLISAGYEIRSYSGRGMFGKQCLGVSTEDHIETVLINVFKQILNDVNGAESIDRSNYDMLDELEAIRGDRMGMKNIYYWPNVEWNDE